MIKSLLALLATSASLAAMLLMTNTAYAAPICDRDITFAISTPAIQIVNLNIIDPNLNLTRQQDNPILHNLGALVQFVPDRLDNLLYKARSYIAQ